MRLKKGTENYYSLAKGVKSMPIPAVLPGSLRELVQVSHGESGGRGHQELALQTGYTLGEGQSGREWECQIVREFQRVRECQRVSVREWEC